MFDFLRKKPKKEYKRPDYYPVCRIKYTKWISKSDRIDELVQPTSNFCCDNFKKEFHEFVGFEDANCFIGAERGYDTYISPNIYYCPFCGAKIVNDCIKTLKNVKTGCDEIIEPEQVIPAKTRKVCKYEWKEVKEE